VVNAYPRVYLREEGENKSRWIIKGLYTEMAMPFSLLFSDFL
jgi:hypothetical protein